MSTSSTFKQKKELESMRNPIENPGSASLQDGSASIAASHPHLQPHGQTQTQTVYIPTHPPPTPAPSPGPAAHPAPSYQPEPYGLALYHHPQSYPNANALVLSNSNNVNSGSAALASQPTPAARLAFLSSIISSCTFPELLFLSQTIAPLLKRDFLSSLPTELALHVLSFADEPKTLTRAAQVCRRWRAVARDEGVWRQLCVYFGFDNVGGEEELWDEEERRRRAKKGKGRDRRRVLGQGHEEEVREGEQSSSSRMIRRRRPPDKHGLDPPILQFSWRRHFRSSYIVRMNWRHGGTLLQSHRLLIVSPDSGTVTSLALDGQWVVVGLSNSKIKIYSAKTGILARTLVGHESGVWGVCLVSAGGWLEVPNPHRGGDGDGEFAVPGQDVVEDLLAEERRRKESRDKKKKKGATKKGSAPKRDKKPLDKPKVREGEDRTLRDGFSGLQVGVAGGQVGTGGDGMQVVPSQSLAYTLPPALRVALGLSVDTSSEEGSSSGTSEPESSSEQESEVGKGQVAEDSSAGRGRGRGMERAKTESEESEEESTSRSRTRTRMAPPGPGRPSNPCFSSSGWGQPNALVVTGGCDKSLRVWDVDSGRCIYVLHGHTSTIRSLRVLHHRPIAVSGARDATLRVWDVQKGLCLRVLEGHQSSVRCLDVCGNRVVSGSYDATCRLWDIDTGECLHVLQGHFHQVYSVAFDGVRIASGGLDTTVRIWSAQTGQCLALLQGHTALVCQLQFSSPSRFSSAGDTDIPNPSFPSSSTQPDTSSSSSTYPPVLSTPILATGGSDGRVITFSLQTYTPLHRIAAHDSSVTSLQFSPSLGYLVTGGNDGRVRLFEVASGRYVRELCEPGECVWKVGFTRSREGGLAYNRGTGAGVRVQVQGGGGEGEVLAITCKRGGKTGVDIWSMGVGAGKFQKTMRRSASGKGREKAKEKIKRSEVSMDGKDVS